MSARKKKKMHGEQTAAYREKPRDAPLEKTEGSSDLLSKATRPQKKIERWDIRENSPHQLTAYLNIIRVVRV